MRLALEVLVFLTIGLVVLSVVGLGIVEFFVPEFRGLQWLLSPVVGLAVMYLACQWLSPVLSSAAIVRAVFLLGAAFTVFVIWRRRRAFSSTLALRRFDLVPSALAGIVAYLALLAHQFKLGFLTLAGTGFDALFVYAPTAEFMRAHSYVAGSTPAVKTPAISTLVANFYPGSLGTVDGGLSALVGRPVYQILEPLNALCVVLALLGVYVLVVGALRLPRLTGLIAMALMATNQFIFWTAGFDFVQQLRAWAILPGALALVVHALDKGRVGAAVLAGALAAALVAIYMPMFFFFAVITFGGLVVAGVVGMVKKRWSVSASALGTVLLSGIVFGIPNIRWLFFDGGWEVWNLVSQDKFGPYVAGGILASHYSPGELLGTSSLANVYRLKPLLFWRSAWTILGNTVALSSLALGGFGLVALVRTRRWLWVGMVSGTVTYLVYVRYVTGNLYGFVKTMSYALPVTSALVAIGFVGLTRLNVFTRLRKPVRKGWVAVATPCALAAILFMQVSAAVETENLFLQLPPTISASDLALRDLQDLVPKDSAVLIEDPGPPLPGTSITANTGLFHVAAYFLAGSNVTLGSPVGSISTADYDYVLASASAMPRPGYRDVWTNATLGLTLYQRTG